MSYTAQEHNDFSGGMCDYPMIAKPNQAHFLYNTVIDKEGNVLQRFGFLNATSAASSLAETTKVFGVLTDIYYPRVIAAGTNKTFYSYLTNGIPVLWAEFTYSDVKNSIAKSQRFNHGASSTGVIQAISGETWKNQFYGLSSLSGTLSDTTRSRPHKFYADSINVFCREVFVPNPSAITVSTSSPGATHSYAYKIHYVQKYTVQGTSFIDYGPIFTHTFTTNVAMGAGAAGTFQFQAAELTALASLFYNQPDDGVGNTADGLWMLIYRTIDTGSTYYFIGAVRVGFDGSGANVTLYHSAGTLASDNLTDAVISAGSHLPPTFLDVPQTLYTTGNLIESDFWTPQDSGASQYFAPVDVMGIVNNRGYYAVGNLLYHSVDGAPSYVSRLTEEPFQSRIRHIGQAGGYPVIITETGVFRYEGGIDELGRNTARAVLIGDKIGSKFNGCGVTVNDTLFFYSPAGVYATNGVSVQRISENLDPKLYTVSGEIQVSYDALRRLVLFTGITPLHTYLPSDGATNYTLVLDLNQPVGPFSTFYLWGKYAFACNLASDDSLLISYSADPSTAGVCYSKSLATTIPYDKDMVSGTQKYYAIHYKAITRPETFGSLSTRKWVSGAIVEMTLDADVAETSNLSIKLTSVNDGNFLNQRDMNPIRYRPGGAIQQKYMAKRTFPASTSSALAQGGLRCTFKQIILEPAENILYSSDETMAGLKATSQVLAGPTYVVTLDSSPYNWPAAQYIEGRKIYFGPSYTTGYTILARTGDDTITVSGDPGLSVATKWEIKGLALGEFFHLDTVVFQGSLLAPNYAPDDGRTGANT